MDEFMEAAIQEAKQGRQEGGIPIGSVLVKDGKILGRGHNKRVQDADFEVNKIRGDSFILSFKPEKWFYWYVVENHYFVTAKLSKIA